MKLNEIEDKIDEMFEFINKTPSNPTEAVVQNFIVYGILGGLILLVTLL